MSGAGAGLDRHTQRAGLAGHTQQEPGRVSDGEAGPPASTVQQRGHSLGQGRGFGPSLAVSEGFSQALGNRKEKAAGVWP